MKIYDISQEVFNCKVFPGDPQPKRELMMQMSEGSLYNLTSLSMCAHNGTHVDAPYHFINDGKTIDQVDLKRFVGEAYVAEHEGEVTAEDAKRILAKAASKVSRIAWETSSAVTTAATAGATQVGNTAAEASKRILIKGKAVVTLEAAQVFAEAGILLLGNESQTVGPEDAPMQVHLKLLGAEVVLLEGIRLQEVPEGVYILNAAPLNLGGADGAPCRAILLEM